MFKVLSNLKKSFLSVIIIVTLLCIQAWTDLELPNYTSRIVNVGIQAGGIENVAPVIIRKSQMDLLLLFTNDDKEILSYYEDSNGELSNSSQGKIEKYLGNNSDLKKEVYVLKDISKEELAKLDNIISKPLMEAYSFSNENMESQIKTQMLENINNISQEQKEILSQMSIADILKTMPEEQIKPILDKMNSQLDEKLGTMISQAAITATKEEYIKLGINTDNIQNEYIFNTGLQMLGVAIISMFAAICIILLSSRVAATLRKKSKRKNI